MTNGTFVFNDDLREILYSHENLVGPIEATASNIERAQEFALEKWKERALERGVFNESEDHQFDLSSACKFCSLFSWILFGGMVRGNYDHQFSVTKDGDLIDLTKGARMFEVFKAEDIDPYKHDKSFFGKDDHYESLESCIPRVVTWVNEYLG